MSITLKQVAINDCTNLLKIATSTFVEMFAPFNSDENMQQYLSEKLTFEKLENELKNPNSVFYFAAANEEIVGYLKINTNAAQTEPQDNQAIEVERIYVSKSHQGQKIGQLLFDKALKIAKEKNATYLWLGVWEENHNAIGFYEKNNLTIFDSHKFTIGNDLQTDYLMRIIF